MGLDQSKYSFADEEFRALGAQMYASRAHVSILVVGEKGSGKTSLTKRIVNVTKFSKFWVHVFDTDTSDEPSIKAKIQKTYTDGIDTSGLSIISESLPLYGIVWVIDARTMNTIQDFEHAREICLYLTSFQNALTRVYFSHTDVASRTNLHYIKTLYIDDRPMVPNSGEIDSERIFYAPLTSMENNTDKDADFTILQMVKPISDWAVVCNTRS